MKVISDQKQTKSGKPLQPSLIDVIASLQSIAWIKLIWSKLKGRYQFQKSFADPVQIRRQIPISYSEEFSDGSRS